MSKFFIVDNFYDNPAVISQVAAASSYDLPYSKTMGRMTRKGYLIPNYEKIVTLKFKMPLRAQFPFLNGFFKKILPNEQLLLFDHYHSSDHSRKIQVINDSTLYYTGVVNLSSQPLTIDFLENHLGKKQLTTIIDKKDFFNENNWNIYESIQLDYNQMAILNNQFFFRPNVKSQLDCSYLQIFFFVSIQN